MIIIPFMRFVPILPGFSNTPSHNWYFYTFHCHALIYVCYVSYCLEWYDLTFNHLVCGLYLQISSNFMVPESLSYSVHMKFG